MASADDKYLGWFDTGQGMGAVQKNNETRFYITAEEAYQALADDLDASAAADSVFYLLGWSCDSNIALRAKPATTVQDALRGFDAKGGLIRAMLWDNRLGAFGTAETVKFINSLKHGAAILDRRTPLAGSHHQKIQALSVHRSAQGQEWDEAVAAYCGGMDLFGDRLASTKGPPAPLHDVHCRVAGPASADLINVLFERWHDHQDGAKATLPKDLPRPPLPALDGFDLVQVGRTYPAFPPEQAYQSLVSQVETIVKLLPTRPPLGDMQDGGKIRYYGFYPARQGVQQVWRMVRTAIRKAQKFIYVEEQYLVNTAIADELANKLKTAGDSFRLVILIGHPDAGVDEPQVWPRRRDFINRLRKADPTQRRWRVSVRKTKMPYAYVHSKTWIFDDELVITGSANLDRRGYTYDSESVVAVAGTLSGSRKPSYGAGTVAQDLRCRLFAKHLGGNPAQYLSITAAFARWFAGPQSGNTTVYNPAQQTGDPDPILKQLNDAASGTNPLTRIGAGIVLNTLSSLGGGSAENALWDLIDDPDPAVPPPK